MKLDISRYHEHNLRPRITAEGYNTKSSGGKIITSCE
jgi:hypothetical protein